MKHYVVWVGRKNGIYKTWNECLKQINKFPNGRYKKFKSKDEAEDAYRMGWEKFYNKVGKQKPTSVIKSNNKSKKKVIKSNIYKTTNNIHTGICVDGACSYDGSIGPMEYQAIDLETGEYIFTYGPFQGTNNIAEFLAIYEALKFCKENNRIDQIFSDSKIAINWIYKKICNTKIENISSETTRNRIKDALDWLNNNEYSNIIYKWDTKNHGENPADFGRK